MKDWVIRALKTFWQAALAVLVAEIPQIVELIPQGWEAMKPVAFSIFVGSLAAGICAIYNKFINPLFGKGEEEETL